MRFLSASWSVSARRLLRSAFVIVRSRQSDIIRPPVGLAAALRTSTSFGVLGKLNFSSSFYRLNVAINFLIRMWKAEQKMIKKSNLNLLSLRLLLLLLPISLAKGFYCFSYCNLCALKHVSILNG